jgi:hypothetical protein
VAETFAVYVFPATNPLIVIGEEDPVAVNVAPLDESVAIAVKPVIAPPPTLEGAVKDIDPAVVSVPIVGASGTFNGKYEAVKNPAWYRIDMGCSYQLISSKLIVATKSPAVPAIAPID